MTDMTRRCSACRVVFPLANFSPRANQCKPCRRLTSAKYRAANRELCNQRAALSEKSNPDKYKGRSGRWARANPDKVEAKRNRYRLKNGDRWKQLVRDWAKKYPERRTESCARRHARRKEATPKWANVQKMREFYREAARITKETGILHVVDHVVPLQGETVSGLHVEFNLRVITQSENLKKSNRLIEELIA